MTCRSLFAMALWMVSGVASCPAWAVPSCDEQLKSALKQGRSAIDEIISKNQVAPEYQQEMYDKTDRGIREKFKCVTSDAPAPGKQSDPRTAQQENPKKENVRRGYCATGAPLPPEPAARTTSGMAAKAPDFYTSCSAEKTYMLYEWRKLCMNGPAVDIYETNAARMDAATAQNRLGEIQNPKYVYQDASQPEYQATDAWEACLMRTRLRQLGEE